MKIRFDKIKLQLKVEFKWYKVSQLNSIFKTICACSKRPTIDVSAQPVFGPHIFPSPIKLRATWESGAKSPLAPTVPFAGTYGAHPAVKYNSKQV